jgi:LSD1 subclass zinc finger protein
LSTPLICVICRAPLAWPISDSATEISCASCHKKYPRLLGRVPILLRDPESHLASTHGNVGSLIRGEEARLAKVESARENGQKPLPALRRIAAGMARNLELYRRWLTLLEQASSALESTASGSALDNTGYTSIVRYLMQDWSRTHESESFIALIRDQVSRDLVDHLAEPGPIVMLGAGTGRLAHELAPREVWALDLSLPMALSYGLLRQGSLQVCDPIEANTFSIEDLYPEHLLRADVTREIMGYIVADALQMPFADRSLAAVLSIYFSDIVPLSALLREATRLLRPGGAFVHFGPLGYSTYQPGEMWTVQEVRELLAEHGLRLRAERLVPHLLHANPRRMSTLHVNAWSFIATYEG